MSSDILSKQFDLLIIVSVDDDINTRFLFISDSNNWQIFASFPSENLCGDFWIPTVKAFMPESNFIGEPSPSLEETVEYVSIIIFKYSN